MTARGTLKPGCSIFHGSVSINSLASLTRSRKADFICTTGTYSKIRRGVHFFSSETFLTNSGHMMGSINAVNTLELKAAMNYLPRH